MSRLFTIIQNQIEAVLRVVMEGDDGQVDWSYWGQFMPPKYLRVIIAFIAGLLYLLVMSVVGMYLWNQGLSVMAPSVIRPFGSSVYSQSQNPFFQLFITLFALISFF